MTNRKPESGDALQAAPASPPLEDRDAWLTLTLAERIVGLVSALRAQGSPMWTAAAVRVVEEELRLAEKLLAMLPQEPTAPEEPR